MALTHKHRSALYEGLSGIVDEEAVNEMLAYFPTRDGDEPIDKDFLRAEMSDLRAELRGEMSDLRAELRGEMSNLRAELRGEMSNLRAELRGEMSNLRVELSGEMSGLESGLVDRIDSKFNQIIAANLATLVAFAAVVITAIKL